MYRLHLTAEDLARTRIAAAPGPFAESILAAERLRQRSPALPFRAWRAQLRGRLDRRTRVLANVFPADANGLDLATLVGPVGTLEEGLDRLLASPLAHLRNELEWYNKRHHLTAWSKSLVDTDAGARRELADAIAALHCVAVRPYWTQIDTQLRADRAARARTVADAGLEHLLATVCPSHVRWRQRTLEVDTPLGCDADVHLDGRGLVLTPSIFVGDYPYLAFDLADPTAPARLTYPAINDLVTARQIWTADRPTGHLAMLLGRTRSAVLETIADGCGTVELARRLGISPASVSQHTAVLRNSGLIGTRRDGPSVIHVVTSLGAMLLDRDPEPRRP
jgi:DNA-binding transcriptional ArsR family regulator